MQNNEIKFGKQTIAKAFEDWYTIPSYQRNYVWESDQVYDFLKDMKDNYIEHANDEYFLGSYIKQVRDDSNDLLDGQQRITTLFLLFAFLRDYEKTDDGLRSSLQEMIFQKANIVKKIPPRIRLDYQIRGNVNQFIKKFIIVEGSITANWDTIVATVDNLKENMTIRHMCNTLVCFKSFFDENDDVDLTKLVQFVSTNVVVIFISADSLEDSFRLFSIMNDRGLKLSSSDILKSSNLEKVSDTKKIDDYARQWEEMQENLGDDIDRFLMYIRTMLLKVRAKTNLLDEFEKNIFKPGVLKRGDAFFDLVFETYAVYDKLIYLTSNDDVEYCNLIRILQSSLQNTDWVPVVMTYYQKFGENELTTFTQKVVCKNIADTVCGDAPSSRIDALNKIMAEVSNAACPAALMSSSCFDFDKTRFLAEIQTDIYGKGYAKSLLMLLEYKYQDNSLDKSFKQISIEHILPQTPKAGSQWLNDFTDDERLNYTHKIGNLIIIGRRKNSSLGNLDYPLKRQKYFDKNIGSFARSLNIYNTYPSHWTPTEYKLNQQKAIDDLKEIFGIK
jgi:uncharacterized protein with ParB-like and HNH nuclease domain